MRPFQPQIFAVLAAACLTAACSTRPNPAWPALGLQITAPSPPAYVSGAVTITVTPDATLPPPATVMLTAGDQFVANLAPPFTHSWDTTVMPEGTYELMASAVVQGARVTSAPCQIIVDRTPPTIVSRTPQPDSANVDIDVPIQITFSEPIAPTSITGVVLTDATSTDVLATPSLSSDGRVLTLTLSTPSDLNLPVDLTTRVSATVADLAGNVIEPSTWSWNLPAWVTFGTLAGDSPSLVLPPDDVPVVAHLTYPAAGEALVHVSRLASTTTWESWTAPVTTRLSRPSFMLALGADGALFASWLDDHVYVARRDADTWDVTYGAADQSPAGSALDHFLTVDSAGRPLVAWAQMQSARSTPVFVSRWAGTSWQGLSTNADFVGMTKPVMAVDKAGRAVVLSCCDPSDDRPLLTRQRADGTWAAIDLSGVLPLGSTLMTGALAVDADDRPVVVTYDGGALSPNFFDGTRWVLSPSRMYPASQSALDEARVSVASDGTITLAWTGVHASSRDLFVARSTGVTWDEAYGSLSAIQGISTDAHQPSMAFDRKGRPVIAWSELDNFLVNTHVARSNH